MFVWLGQINDAIRMYEEIEPWQFHHCWVILRGEPKWHVKMAECNTGQRVNRKHSLKGSEIDINSMQTDSALPERPEGRDSAKKRSRVMTDTSSSSTDVEMLQKMNERGEKNDDKEDQLRQEMFQMEREARAAEAELGEEVGCLGEEMDSNGVQCQVATE